VILTSSSDEKLEVGRSLGADFGVNYRSAPDWEHVVREITDGRGADLVVDLGGPDSLDRSVKATRMDGTVAIIGVLSGFGTASISVTDAMMNNIHLSGVTVGSVQDHIDMCAAMERGAIRPHISHRLGWDALVEAQGIMQAGMHIGKVVIEIP
jgi:NADPH:quinone reductase-like Zn-dependent oxidoreductase